MATFLMLTGVCRLWGGAGTGDMHIKKDKYKHRVNGSIYAILMPPGTLG